MNTIEKPGTPFFAGNDHADVGQFQEWINRFNEDGSANTDGFTLTDAAFLHFVTYNRLEGLHNDLLLRVNADRSNLQAIGDEAREIIWHLRIPQDLAGAILFSYHDVYHGAKPKIAVLGAANATGLHDYVLDVAEDDLIRAVKYVYASLYTDRAINYYLDHSLDCNSLRMPVLIEKMPGL
jgi:pyruvate,water dikinase